MSAEMIKAAFQAGVIITAIEQLDEKVLAEMCGIGVTVQGGAQQPEIASVAKQGRITLKRFELLLRMKRDLARIEKLTRDELAEAMAHHQQRLAWGLDTGSEVWG